MKSSFSLGYKFTPKNIIYYLNFRHIFMRTKKLIRNRHHTILFNASVEIKCMTKIYVFSSIL